MLKLSTKSRYGVRLMLALAAAYAKGTVTLKDIAAQEGISEKYLLHIVPRLKGAGFIYATRGAYGGYALARPPGKINLYDIVSVLEGPVCLVDCVFVPSSCARASRCVSRRAWKGVADRIKSFLSGLTLEALLAD